jgi:RNA polymerase sigma-70 factor (ECF subfamily)
MQLTLNEQELVAKARNGDEGAVTLLYDAHIEAVFDYIRYRVDSTEEAEDLTSEVFLRMVRGLVGYKEQGVPFRAWLYRIAANLIVDHYRRREKTKLASAPEYAASDEPDPLDHLANEEEAMHLRLALRRLPEEYQNLLILRFVEDLPHTEISKILNKSAVSLRAMQYRALKALAEQLNELSTSYNAFRKHNL